MAILNWRDHPRLRFVDFPPPFLTKGSVFIASDKGDTAWISDGTAYLQLYPTATTAQDLGVMNWASKPAPNSVPAGTRFTASDLLMSDWQALNGYWTPVNGRAVVYAPDTTGIQAQSATQELVAGIPGWTVPADLANVPNIFIEAQAVGYLTNPSNVQSRSLHVGISASSVDTIVFTSLQSANPFIRSWGRCHRINATTWRRPAANSQPYVNSANADLTNTLLTSAPLRLIYQGGNTDGSEILNVHSFSLAIGIG